VASARPEPYLQTATEILESNSMNKRQSWATVGVVLLCGGILVLFTDIEVGMVRWVNCGPLATEGEQQSEVCR
ncbi:MAG: hypothetical protein VYE46_02275, partial [Cyanobacteriota bacterium]|nr:hypothetical protein [Cyanobacteriota bacterium]